MNHNLIHLQYVLQLDLHGLLMSFIMPFIVFVIIHIVLVAATVYFNHLKKVDKLTKFRRPCDSENFLHLECACLQLTKHYSEHMQQIQKCIVALVLGFPLLNKRDSKVVVRLRGSSFQMVQIEILLSFL